MLLKIDKHSGVPIFRQIIDQVTQQILTGQLSKGAQLTTVRELAAQLKVNPMTVSKAYSLLEMEGLADRQRGIGLFVAELPNDVKKKARTNVAEQALKKAALSCRQLKISESEAKKLFSKFYRSFDKTGSKSNE